MTMPNQTERRWLRAVIAASAEPLPDFPWMRGQRRRPAAMKPQAEVPTDTIIRRVPLFSKPAIAAR